MSAGPIVGGLVGGILVGAAVGAGVGFAVATGPNRTRRPALEPVEQGTTPNTPPRTTLEAFVAARDSRGNREFRPLSTKPASSKIVPIVARVATPLVAGANYERPEGLALILRELKSLLRTANRGAEDPRCVWSLWEHETAGGRACWSNNWGNVKGRTWCYADDATILSGKAWSSSTFSDRFWLVQGRYETNVECYLGFPNALAWCKFQGAMFSGGSYRGMLQAYQAGGLEGLKQAERILGAAGYSGANATVRVVRAERWWAAKQQLMGAEQWEALK